MQSSIYCTRAFGSLTTGGVSGAIRRRRPHIQFYRQRQLSTRPPFRQLETTSAAAPLEDGFIPFDFSIGETKRSSPGVKTAKGKTKTDKLDEDWHAEIEIAAAWPQETQSVSSSEAVVSKDEQVTVQAVTQVQSPTVDNVSLHHVVPPSEDGSTLMTVQTPLLPPQKTETEIAQRPRAENRLLRKLRRIEAGLYTRGKEKQEEEPTPEEGVLNVLEKIDAMDEGGVSTKKKRERRVRKAEDGQVEVTAQVGQARRSRERIAVSAVDAESTAKQHKNAAAKRPGATTERGQTTTSARKRDKKTATFTPPPPQPPPRAERWQREKDILEKKFGTTGWQPRKRLSPDTLDGIRALHASDPAAYSTGILAEHFQITPEAIRRVLRSKWRPNTDETEDRRERWEKRGVKKWSEMAEKGVRPPAKWRAMGIKNVNDKARGKGSGRPKKDEYVEWEEQSFAGQDGGDEMVERIL